MEIFVIGLNHNSAPVEIRELFAVTDDRMAKLYGRILAHNSIYEALILSTCNRVEIYYVSDNTHDDSKFVIDVLIEGKEINLEDVRNYFYIYKGREALEHIFEVAAGIDSMVVGEPQIFGQVKDAFRKAREYEAARKVFTKLEEITINCVKKIKTNTKISENPITVSSAAVELVKKIYGSLENRKALIIGAGEMCILAAKYLANEKLDNIFVANRTYEKAKSLAEEIGGLPIEFYSIVDYLSTVDIVLTSTSSKDFIIHYDDVNKTMALRKYSPLFFIDIAVPRDVDPRINDVENVYVYDIDDLKSVVEMNKKKRKKEIEKAKYYIKDSINNYYRWLKTIKISPVIVAMRNYFDEIKQIELERQKSKQKIEDKEEIKKLNRALSDYANKLLHKPIINIKINSLDDKKFSLTEAIRILFDLNDDKKKD
ncbi:MAG: glutamyl-tRNA reductase [Deferribacterota bacterium]|nr:glutamyl-tRNA reductase [Deferribacterota bacterium]